MAYDQRLDGSIGLTITCGDGRVQDPTDELRTQVFPEVINFDTLTAPGPDAYFKADFDPEAPHGDSRFGVTKGFRKASFLADMSIYMTAHPTCCLHLDVHEECAGHPCDLDQHRIDVIRMANELEEVFPQIRELPTLVTITRRIEAEKPGFVTEVIERRRMDSAATQSASA